MSIIDRWNEMKHREKRCTGQQAMTLPSTLQSLRPPTLVREKGNKQCYPKHHLTPSTTKTE